MSKLHMHEPDPLRDPFGIATHAHKARASREEQAHDEAAHQVNPLWMITAGLAAFLILLVAVW